MGNVLNLLLKVCVIFNIDAVGNYDICNITCSVNILCVNGYFYFCPGFHFNL